MNIKDINQMSDDIFIDYFKNIFEKTPLLAKLASSNKPFKDKNNLIDIEIVMETVVNIHLKYQNL